MARFTFWCIDCGIYIKPDAGTRFLEEASARCKPCLLAFQKNVVKAEWSANNTQSVKPKTILRRKS